MGMVMLNHELVEFGAYPYVFAPEVEVWREEATDKDSDISVSSSSEFSALGYDLDPSVNLAVEPVMEDILYSLLGFSLSANPNPPVKFSPIIPILGAEHTLSVVSTGSSRPNVDSRSKRIIPAPRSLPGEGDECVSNSVISVASSLATEQQFQSEDLCQSNWYKKSTSYSR
ncbi:hypothetical protein AYI68_g5516 [Smittium mucronatum]|uniref:Uncharacterized protein n=1 Tax=Smittium mucronatum TaxID=133383 RepID=A0A1R0GU27_9FUNG|nr:hypothetical protein AYI68_g5516 [Smittium mucronatum]